MLFIKSSFIYKLTITKSSTQQSPRFILCYHLEGLQFYIRPVIHFQLIFVRHLCLDSLVLPSECPVVPAPLVAKTVLSAGLSLLLCQDLCCSISGLPVHFHWPACLLPHHHLGPSWRCQSFSLVFFSGHEAASALGWMIFRDLKNVLADLPVVQRLRSAFQCRPCGSVPGWDLDSRATAAKPVCPNWRAGTLQDTSVAKGKISTR